MRLDETRTDPRNASLRSRGETQIARCLGRHGIAYLYEHPLAVVDEGRTKIWYPDFQLPGYGILIEYCGMIGDAQYDQRLLKKQQVYRANGIEGLFWMPEDFKGDWPRRLLDRIENTLSDRLLRFQTQRPFLPRYRGPQDSSRRPFAHYCH